VVSVGTYEEFIASKRFADPPTGITHDVDINPMLFEWQRDIVRWALRRGRAAMFEDCGLGKTGQQLEWAKHVAYSSDPGGHVLILTPLAVAQQTVREAEKFGIQRVNYVRSQEEIGGDFGIWITNYEMLDRFDPSMFRGVVLDESSILKSFDGSTRTKLIEAFRETPFRLACTATPAPNDHMELGNHAEFLGVMTRAEMLSMFFVHDGGETQKWRIKGHARDAFWKWVCSWAVNLRKPSDLGYSDDGFILPKLHIHHHVVESDMETARQQGLLFQLEARTLAERRSARKASTDARVALIAEMVNHSTDPWLVWCNLNAEGDALEKAIPDSVQVAGSDSIDDKSERLLGFAADKYRVLVTKSKIAGFGMNWQHCANVAFCGLSDSWEQYYQAIRRCWRFGQKNEVHCHIVTSDAEGAVVANIQRKEAEAAEMAAEMIANMSVANSEALRGTRRDSVAYEPRVEMRIPEWLKGGCGETDGLPTIEH